MNKSPILLIEKITFRSFPPHNRPSRDWDKDSLPTVDKRSSR